MKGRHLPKPPTAEQAQAEQKHRRKQQVYSLAFSLLSEKYGNLPGLHATEQEAEAMLDGCFQLAERFVDRANKYITEEA